MSDSEKRVVVIMPKDMADYLEDKAKRVGVGNVSAFLRMKVREMMNEDGVPESKADEA